MGFASGSLSVGVYLLAFVLMHMDDGVSCVDFT